MLPNIGFHKGYWRTKMKFYFCLSTLGGTKNAKIIIFISLTMLNMAVVKECGCIYRSSKINNFRNITEYTGQWKQKSTHENTGIRVIVYVIIHELSLKYGHSYLVIQLHNIFMSENRTIRKDNNSLYSRIISMRPHCALASLWSVTLLCASRNFNF